MPKDETPASPPPPAPQPPRAAAPAPPPPWAQPPVASAPPAAAPPATPSPVPPAPAGTIGAPAPDLREQVVEVLQGVYDPEIPVNIYDLGLVYGVDVTPEGDVAIRMTLTSPACPVAGTLPPEVEQKVKALPGVRSAKVDVVWDPPWDRSKLSEAARLQLGFY